MPRWCWPTRRPTSPTRRSPRCSCRPSTSPTEAARCSRRGAAASRRIAALDVSQRRARRRSRRRAAIRDRPGALSRTGRRRAQRGVDRRRAPAVRYRGHRARSGGLAAAPGAHCAGRDCAARLLDRCRADPRHGARRAAPSTARPGHSTVSRSRPRTRRARSSKNSESTRTTRATFNAWPARAVPRPLAPRRAVDPRGKRIRAAGPLGLRHLRRSAHGAGRARDRRRCRAGQALLRAHAYWRRKRLAVDLVILNEAPPPPPLLARALEESAQLIARSRRRG